MTMKEKVTKVESESEMCVLGNEDYEKVKVECLGIIFFRSRKMKVKGKTNIM